MEHSQQHSDSKKEAPVTYAEVNDTVLKMLEPPGAGWFLLLFTCLFFLAIGAAGTVGVLKAAGAVFGASAATRPATRRRGSRVRIGWGMACLGRKQADGKKRGLRMGPGRG